MITKNLPTLKSVINSVYARAKLAKANRCLRLKIGMRCTCVYVLIVTMERMSAWIKRHCSREYNGINSIVETKHISLTLLYIAIVLFINSQTSFGNFLKFEICDY